MKILNDHISEIKTICRNYKVKSLFAFGSVLSDKFSPDSDIDLVVDILSNDPFDYTDNYFNLKSQLEQILNRQIDLLEDKTINNPFLKKQIDSTKLLLYAA